jgi:flagellar biosynthesis protein FlhG
MKSFAPRLCAVGSGKGGTGKTFLTLALARSFAAHGERVLVCDADLGLANTAVQLGIANGGDLPGLIAGRTDFKHAIAPLPDPEGFDLLAAPAGSGQLADAGEKTAERLIGLLLAARGYDRILLDLSAGVSAGIMTLAAHADEALVVVTPDPSAITDAYAFVKLMAKRTGGRMPGMVVNRVTGSGEAKRTADALAQAARSFLKAAPDYLGAIPEDWRVTETIRRQQTLHAIYPQSPAATAIDALANLLGKETGRLKTAPALR